MRRSTCLFFTRRYVFFFFSRFFSVEFYPFGGWNAYNAYLVYFWTTTEDNLMWELWWYLFFCIQITKCSYVRGGCACVYVCGYMCRESAYTDNTKVLKQMKNSTVKPAQTKKNKPPMQFKRANDDNCSKNTIKAKRITELRWRKKRTHTKITSTNNIQQWKYDWIEWIGMQSGRVWGENERQREKPNFCWRIDFTLVLWHIST